MFDAWKQFQTNSPNCWWKMVMNPMVESVKHHLKPSTHPSIVWPMVQDEFDTILSVLSLD